MLRIKPSPTADSRTGDHENVRKEQLLASSKQHIRDVRRALGFFEDKLWDAGREHDKDKLADIDGFHTNFVTGFKERDWLDRHYRLNRHHLNEETGVREDVNLIDVLDMVADIVMAGMARSGEVYPVEIPDEVLQRAVKNTVEMLKGQVEVGK